MLKPMFIWVCDLSENLNTKTNHLTFIKNYKDWESVIAICSVLKFLIVMGSWIENKQINKISD